MISAAGWCASEGKTYCVTGGLLYIEAFLMNATGPWFRQ
ncbi:uncharacterized protein METZ01_LOCUS51249 [marine metagenome]|uniref:Uncharacterized protein n=1 Tax=marine metagenome TaxID=408172 RepID=A0A381S2Q9_9ZZZZ